MAAKSIASYANNRPRVIPFGDSITYGVGSNNAAGYREPLWRTAAAAGVPFAFGGTQLMSGALNTFTEYPLNEGYGGITAANLITMFGAMAPEFTDVATFAAGTNDIADGADTATTAGSISSALDQLWAKRVSDRFQIGLYTILRRLDGFNTTVQAVNALLPGIIAGKSYAANVTLIDIYASCSVASDYSDAVVHPNDVGYAKVAAAAYPTLATILGRVLLR